MSVIRIAELRAEPLSADEMQAVAADPAAGAIVVFTGTVRDHDHGQGVTGLSYTAHPSAAAEIFRVAEKVAASHPIVSLAVTHRTGDLQIGDLAVVAAVGAAHRDVAFAACHALIDEVKATVPIWKHQLFTDGSSEWVNSA
ncbi:MAG: molybdenum cofactor biosynthesis protein MoaE [Actinobacteria bacterium]|nr:molybdenum cofactor biosynthesis protein MoaE [Actinomycetota bacterium]MBO0830593.1 molybdenum cofactor biosynthesis protein MoaE [Actinomycetota bacterium]MBO0834452.1 molybdenum cofactor biosynthesis protein MoaE [Actinomycetota bacterium]